MTSDQCYVGGLEQTFKNNNNDDKNLSKPQKHNDQNFNLLYLLKKCSRFKQLKWPKHKKERNEKSEPEELDPKYF